MICREDWMVTTEVHGTRQRRAQAALLALMSCVGIAYGAEGVSIVATRHETAVAIKARATIRAPFALIWQTLTDYENLPAFIPGIKTSRVVERRGNAVIVKQSGHAGFLFFTYTIDVVVESFEHPPSSLTVRVLEGNLKQLDGGYRLEKVGDKADVFLLQWSGIIEPAISLPFFIAVPLMRSNIADQFTSMVNEIERRAALPANSEPR